MQENILWRRVLEGAVIVGSILLAFSIDRGYENWQDSKEEQAIFLGLSADFTANQETLKKYIEYYESMTAQIAVVLRFIEHGSNTAEQTAIGEALTLLYNNPTFDPRTATLDLIESSGSGSLLKDTALKGLISEWRMHADDALDQQLGLQRNRETMLWPKLVGLNVQTSEGRQTLLDMPQEVPSLERMRESELAAVLDVYAALVSRTQIDLVELLGATDDVLDRLVSLLQRGS